MKYFKNTFKKNIFLIFRKEAQTDKQKYKKSYSQCGEDIIVDYIFNLRGITYPTYIDIGANDPYYLSNTALFYDKGCRGINIEPNPAMVESFGKSRPADINLNIG